MGHRNSIQTTWWKMIYWHCRPSIKTRLIILTTAAIIWFLLIQNPYFVFQLVVMFCLIAIICFEMLSKHQKLPLAISYQQQFWRCFKSNKIIDYSLQQGFVIGPFAVLRLRSLDKYNRQIFIVMMYYDIKCSDQSQAANWNQLRTTLRYCQKDCPSKKDNWLVG